MRATLPVGTMATGPRPKGLWSERATSLKKQLGSSIVILSHPSIQDNGKKAITLALARSSETPLVPGEISIASRARNAGSESAL